MSESCRRLRGLYAITPETGDLPGLLRRVGEAIEGGARLVQFRAKSLAPAARQRQGEALLALCRARGVPLIVHDDLALALALGADGLHLGREDGDPREARERLPGAILGVSCYDDPALVAAAAAAGADYVGVGSVFPSATKPGAARAGLAGLAEARRRTTRPIAAIGGITPDNAAQAVAAGADMLAVIAALFDAPDVVAAARALSRPLETEDDPHARAQPAAF
jgi:thiamine-phosphate pyrophosphorylase